MKFCRAVLLIGALLLLVGCAGSKLASRKRERSSAYAQLPFAHQQLVDQGRIEAGMSTNAVYVAWGNPARVVAPNAPGTFTWIYVCQDTVARSGWTSREVPGPRAGAGAYYQTVDRGTIFASVAYECAEVNFENYVVKSWREIPKPEN